VAGSREAGKLGVVWVGSENAELELKVWLPAIARLGAKDAEGEDASTRARVGVRAGVGEIPLFEP